MTALSAQPLASRTLPVHTNPHLIVVQRRLYDPHYQASGRWIIVDPTTRRAFVAVGGRRHTGTADTDGVSNIGGGGSTWPTWMQGRRHQDVVSDVLRVLAAASDGPVATAELLAAANVEDHGHLDRLLAAGLLRTGTVERAPTSYLERYHRAVFDYPFHDYYDKEWHAKDVATMAEYQSAWAPPPPLTERAGEPIALPEVSPHDAVSHPPGGDLTPRTLAAVLHLALAPTGWRTAPVVGPLAHRTSPSGGGRHPTEVVVLLSRALGHVPPGAYHYDSGRHALTPAPAYADQLNTIAGPCGLLVISHVERAMWRYREIRSFRPISIDAGHVVETLALLLGQLGHEVTVGPPLCAEPVDHDAVTEPALALLVVSGHATSTPPAPAPADDGAFCTNPTLHLTFDRGGLTAHVGWPERTSTRVSLSELQVLGHCLPSRHGDRDTSPTGVRAAVPEVPPERLEHLRTRQTLLPREVGHRLDRGVGLWAKYGWYLSLLAHLDIRAGHRQSGRELASQSRPVRLTGLAPERLVDSLLARRTCRAFSSVPVAREDVESVLGETTRGAAEELIPLGAALRVVVAPLAVAGLPTGAVHEWNVERGTLDPLDITVGRDVARALTIGQEPMSTAAVVTWFMARVPLDRPAGYELTLLSLGRLGQRMCILATDRGLGVFMTPAVCDAATFAKLRIPDGERTLTYALGMGNRRGDR
ncbi:hypothetical protein SAMN05216266_10410 [Amycolatopsis marina]|uniref:Uncharacterized protein n=1 Tax=Amycolatopsis marina TaxID=490629 RepID=A0A1I0XVA1_9PSEU|nr:nitroreductase family protein [Amycolatopsis marina]SFB04587.1 hypothetical protein SAMN05216266_10410 [Amycolatopsis marina]